MREKAKQAFFFTIFFVAVAFWSPSEAFSSADAEALLRKGSFAFHRGDPELALKSFEKVLFLSPFDNAARENLAATHNHLGLKSFNNGSLERALFHLRAAASLVPGNETIRENLGGLERLSQTSNSISEGLGSLVRANYGDLRVYYPDSADPEEVKAVCRLFVEAEDSIGKAFGIRLKRFPDLVLHRGGFSDLSYAVPERVQGIYDGAVRVSLDGSDIRRTIRHELTHHFVNLVSRGNCPVWLNEGIAQIMDGSSSAGAAELVLRHPLAESLQDLNLGNWFDYLYSQEPDLANALALLETEKIVSRNGVSGLVRMLQVMATDGNPTSQTGR